MTQIIPDIINIVIEAIFAILGLFFTGVAVPWLIKTGIPWLKDKRLRREFSANVSHELKTPLTSISGFAELMKEGLVPPEKIPEFSCAAHPEVRLCGADA